MLAIGEPRLFVPEPLDPEEIATASSLLFRGLHLAAILSPRRVIHLSRTIPSGEPISQAWSSPAKRPKI